MAFSRIVVISCVRMLLIEKWISLLSPKVKVFIGAFLGLGYRVSRAVFPEFHYQENGQRKTCSP